MAVNTFVVNSDLALLTKHGKEAQIGPVFSEHFDTKICVTNEFDTDTLGSFDGLRPRTLSPIDAALKKAYIACEVTGLSQGIGSEGSFNTHMLGACSNTEVIAFIDTDIQLEVLGFAQQFVPFTTIPIDNENEFQGKFSVQIQALGPKQKWMLVHENAKQIKGMGMSEDNTSGVGFSSQNGSETTIIKGLAMDEILNHVEQWPVTVEPDFRAMHCPHRQHTISLATKNAVDNIMSRCPKCNWPNFVPKNRKRTNNEQVKNACSYVYLTCDSCGAPTTKAKPPMPHCDNCEYIPVEQAKVATASSYYCTVCNP